MKHLIAAACAVLSLGAASAAFADGQVTATLEQPQLTHVKLVAGQAVFRCADTSCVAGYAPDVAGTVDGCKALVRQVGRVSAYSQVKPLDEKSLAKCNSFAAAPKAATTASR